MPRPMSHRESSQSVLMLRRRQILAAGLIVSEYGTFKIGPIGSLMIATNSFDGRSRRRDSTSNSASQKATSSDCWASLEQRGHGMVKRYYQLARSMTPS